MSGFDGMVRFVAFSLDGTTVAGSDGVTIALWDIFSGRVSTKMKLADRPAEHLAMSTNGRFFSASIGRQLTTWDMNSGQLVSRVEHSQRISRLTYLDSARLAVAGKGQVQIITSANGDVLSYVDTQPALGIQVLVSVRDARHIAVVAAAPGQPLEVFRLPALGD